MSTIASKGIEWECIRCGDKFYLMMPDHSYSDANELLMSSLMCRSICCEVAVRVRLLGYGSVGEKTLPFDVSDVRSR